MKKIIYIKSLLLAGAFLFISCDSRLDEKMEMDASSSFDYTSSDGAKGAMLGAYWAFQDMGWEQIPLISVRGDDVNAGGGNDYLNGVNGDQAPFGATDVYVYDSNFWMYNSLWASWYQHILQIVTQIDQLEKFKNGGVDPALINQYQAECKVMSAFLHLQISKMWGKVILVDTRDQEKLTMKSKDEIMQWISAQMDEAIPNLPDMRPNQRTDIRGGVTKYTALAIKAMANLELKNYQAVADATGMIINSNKYSLYTDFNKVFKTEGKLSNENLLEIQYSDLGVASGGNSINHLWAFYGPQGWSPVNIKATDGWGFYEPSMKYIKFMLSRGEKTRLQSSVLFTNKGINKIKEDPAFATLPTWVTNTTIEGDVINNYPRAMFASGKHYLPSKEYTPGRTDYGSNKNYIVTRYSEILLMYAEAVARGANPTAGTAVAAVNLVRQRAGLSALSSVTADQVMDEKYAELGMEWGIRYFDMVRLGNVAALSYDGRTFTMDKQFLPYPLAQIDKINALK